MRRVAVIGSTGSIGRSTLDVIESHPDRLELLAVAARSRTDLLAEQVSCFKPPIIAVWEEQKAQELSRLIGRDVLCGLDGLNKLASDPRVDVVVVASSGCDALIPLIHAIQAGKRVALASKELLVMAGELIMRLALEHGSSIVPIDSEHAALFQCLQGVPKEQVAHLIITGSGGSLWGKTSSELNSITLTEVLAHPKWRMGPKITVDSATLMNKGLELIEAQWLFDMPLDRLKIVIHPEALIHGVVELIDGTYLMQMAPCDMRLPIQHALSFPERWNTSPNRLELSQLRALHFIQPDLDQFPCLRLALAAASAGGSSCVVLNGANDAAVRAYLNGNLSFSDIPAIVEQTLAAHLPVLHPTLEEILSIDAWSRNSANALIQSQMTQTHSIACSRKDF